MISGVQNKEDPTHTFMISPSCTHFVLLMQIASRHIETKSLDEPWSISEFLLFCLKSALGCYILHLHEER